MSELLARLDSDEFVEWMAFYSMEPWGDERADIRSAIVAHTVAAPHSKRPLKLTDFIPQFEQQHRTQDWREVQAYFRALARRSTKTEKHGHD